MNIVQHILVTYGIAVGLKTDGFTGHTIKAACGRIGDSILFTAYAPPISMQDAGKHGEIVRFNRNGKPVIEYDSAAKGGIVQHADRDGCAALTMADEDGEMRLLYTQDGYTFSPRPSDALAGAADQNTVTGGPRPLTVGGFTVVLEPISETKAAIYATYNGQPISIGSTRDGAAWGGSKNVPAGLIEAPGPWHSA